MKIASDPNDTLQRLIRGTVYDSAPHQVAKLHALSGVSAVGAAAYARVSGTRPPPGRPRKAAGSVDDDPAVIVRFHAAAATTMIQAMIAAAAADGEIDDLENMRIMRYLRNADATPEELAYARIAMEHPVTVAVLADGVKTREAAIEIYAAALLATQAATPGSRAFLGELSRALNLDKAFVTKLHAGWGEPPPE